MRKKKPNSISCFFFFGFIFFNFIGRAGRVRPGICLKLYSSRTAHAIMKAASEPELRRVPLEEVCLSILASGFVHSTCMDFLSQAPQPPTNDSVQSAVTLLEEIGAIHVEEDERRIDNNNITSKIGKRKEFLTPLGKHLAKLPMDVRLGKMLIFGALFRCTDKALTIAAALSSQPIFSTFLGANATVAKAKQREFADSNSDFVTLCNVWESYNQATTTASARTTQSSTRVGYKFCQSNYLNYSALREIGDSRCQYLDLLCSIGFVDPKEVITTNGRRVLRTKSIYNENGNNVDLLHAVICAGLYPNVAHLEQPTTSSNITIYHKEERLYFHDTSVNSKKKQFKAKNNWIIFHEKFGTSSRVSISTTAPVHPMALLLFGGSDLMVKHADRLMILDDWIRIRMGAQLGVILIDLRKRLDMMLETLIDQTITDSSLDFNNTISFILKVLTL